MNDPMMAMADQFADLDRRLRTIEGGQRVGLGGLRSAWATNMQEHTVFGAWNSGPVAATWADDRDNTGTGYPAITIENCPSRYMILWSLTFNSVATNVTLPFRTSNAQIGVSINANDTPPLPNATRLFSNSNPGSTDVAMSMIVARQDVPGDKVFQFRTWCFDDFPAGSIPPTLQGIYLGVLPLSVA